MLKIDNHKEIIGETFVDMFGNTYAITESKACFLYYELEVTDVSNDGIRYSFHLSREVYFRPTGYKLELMSVDALQLTTAIRIITAHNLKKIKDFKNELRYTIEDLIKSTT